MCRNNEQQTTSNGETWSRLPFDVNVMVNLSRYCIARSEVAREIGSS